MSDALIRVAVEAPLLGPLTYLNLPNAEPVRRGQSVVVPLGKRQAKGVVLGPSQDAGKFKLKPIEALIETRPTIPETHLRWLEWLAEYYMHPVGQVTALSFPPLEPKAGIRKSKKAPLIRTTQTASTHDLTDDQKKVVADIGGQAGFHVHLLHGVTGSGKTEVYLQLLARVLAQGQQALVLVPEISLTPQLLDRFASRFGDQIAVLHSHLTEREKTEQWWAAVGATKPILIGARSALFCPLQNLGMIVIDEEHEASFKQDEKLKYHARDAAIMMAKLRNCPIVLGSATPALETWQRAQEGRFQLHTMPQRIQSRQLPNVEVVDLRDDRRQRRDVLLPERPFWLSEQLHLAIEETIAAKEQVALFLNRRGIAQTALCSDCGHTFECPNCAISLTVHAKNHLVCHYCDYTARLLEHCPQCQSHEVGPLGLGTELIEDDIRKMYPDLRVARADRDEIQNREDLESLISKMETGEIDILIGTQMIAKGLDFPKLTLVGLVMADVGFSMPDFRASERSFQLLTQVGGRAGRHSVKPGRVIVQTYNPEHAAIQFAQQHDYAGFADQEIKTRSELHYPPFSRLAMIRLQGPSLGQAEAAADTLRLRATQLCASRKDYSGIQVLGPAPAPIAKLRGKFRFHALIKGEDPKVLRAFCQQLISDSAWLPSGSKASIDIDPINML